MRSTTALYDTEKGWTPCLSGLDSERTLVVVFGASDLIDDVRPIRDLCDLFTNGCVIGCSTSGQIVEDSIEDGGAVAVVMQFDSGEVRATCVEATDDSVGATLGRTLAAPDLQGVFVLSDGAKVNGSALAHGMEAVLPSGTPVTGGLAGDGTRFERTWVCCNGEPREGMVAAVGLYGARLRLLHGCRGGWDPFGPEREVTRSEGAVLYELDGRPALSIYEEYLGERAADLPASALLFPLALRRPDREGVLVRTVLGVSREDHSMTFAGDIPQGSRVQLMQGNLDRVIDGASVAAGSIDRDVLDSGESVCIPISCVGRRLVLRHRAEDELEEVRSALPQCATQVGFYSYGEISPLTGSTCELHNQTMTLTVIAELAEADDASSSRSQAA